MSVSNKFNLKDLTNAGLGYAVTRTPPFSFKAQNLAEEMAAKAVAKVFGKKEKENSEFDLQRIDEYERTFVNDDSSAGGVSYFFETSFMPIWLVAANGDWIYLPNTVMSMENTKTFAETPMAGRGTIKEEIQGQDWTLTITGVILSDDNNYPEEQVNQLMKIYRENNSVGIQNARASLALDGEKLVIKSLKLPSTKGFQNVQAFEMTCVSDVDFELEVI